MSHEAPLPTTRPRSRGLERLIRGTETSDGAGVRLTRVLSQPLQQRLDPFLMLDAFRSDDPRDYIGGFPNHPHRGFETITYMLAGRMRHHDSTGNEGLLGPGGAQWMTAGRGLIHSELPEQEDGLMEGFQLWLNLPAKSKMIEPFYRDIPSAAIPEFHAANGLVARVIAGSSHGVEGAVQRPDTQPLYLDIHLPANASFEQPVPASHNAFVYVYRGAVSIDGAEPPAGSEGFEACEVPERYMGLLRNDGGEVVRLRSAQPARLLLIAGQPLNEPIAQHGPFVMNTKQELLEAFSDFQRGRFAAEAVKAL